MSNKLHFLIANFCGMSELSRGSLQLHIFDVFKIFVPLAKFYLTPLFCQWLACIICIMFVISGASSLAVAFGSSILSSFFVPMLIEQLGCRLFVFIVEIGYLIFILCNVYSCKYGLFLFSSCVLFFVFVSSRWLYNVVLLQVSR